MVGHLGRECARSLPKGRIGLVGHRLLSLQQPVHCRRHPPDLTPKECFSILLIILPEENSHAVNSSSRPQCQPRALEDFRWQAILVGCACRCEWIEGDVGGLSSLSGLGVCSRQRVHVSSFYFTSRRPDNASCSGQRRGPLTNPRHQRLASFHRPCTNT